MSYSQRGILHMTPYDSTQVLHDAQGTIEIPFSTKNHNINPLIFLTDFPLTLRYNTYTRILHANP
jgi:hypothetical protein